MKNSIWKQKRKSKPNDSVKRFDSRTGLPIAGEEFNVPNTRRLSPRQKKFVDEYLIDFDAKNAALRAGYSEKTADKMVHKLTNHPEVSRRINIELARQARRTEITADSVVFELGKVAFSDIRELFDENGCLKAIKDIPPHIAAAIASIEVDSKLGDDGQIVSTSKIKLWNKMQALELLGKRFKLFTEKMEIGGVDGQPVKFHFHFQPPEPKQLNEPPPPELLEDNSDVSNPPES